MKRLLTASLVLASLVVAQTARAQGQWLHVDIVDQRDRQTSVRLNLPLASIAAALPLIPQERVRHCRIELNDRTITRAEIALMVEKLRTAPEYVVLTIERDGDKLDATRAKDMLVISTHEENLNSPRLQLRIPMTVAEALSAGNRETLDLHAAARALVRRGAGELVLISSDEHRVRIWADGAPDGMR